MKSLQEILDIQRNSLENQAKELISKCTEKLADEVSEGNKYAGVYVEQGDFDFCLNLCKRVEAELQAMGFYTRVFIPDVTMYDEGHHSFQIQLSTMPFRPSPVKESKSFLGLF